MPVPKIKKIEKTAITCLMPSDQVAELRLIAHRRELSQADIVRELLRRGLELERRNAPTEAA
jgi:hypothetical protein